jgi:hypothetical protein
MISRRRLSCIVAAWLVGLAVVGCSSRQKSGRPDIDEIPEIEHRGKATKNALYEFRAKVKKRGVAAAKQDLPDLLENIQAHEKLKLGAHNATYKELAEKLQALQSQLGGSPTKDAVLKSIDEICTVGEKLPGEANKEPVVE